MNTILGDLKHSLRMFRRSPGFAATVVEVFTESVSAGPFQVKVNRPFIKFTIDKETDPPEGSEDTDIYSRISLVYGF